MTDDRAEPENRLRNIEAAMEKISLVVSKIDLRVEVIHEEFQRSATQMHRLGLNQESAKLAAHRHEKAVRELAGELAELRLALGRDK